MSTTPDICYNVCMRSAAPHRWFLLCGGVTVAALAWWAQVHRAHVLVPGDRLAALPLRTLASAPMTLSPDPGHPLIVNVFASWCPPCRAETPVFADAAPALRAAGIRIVGIDRDESPAQVRRFAQHYGISYPIYIDASNVTHDLLGVRMIPTTIVIDARGVIRAEHAGPIGRGSLLAMAAER